VIDLPESKVDFFMELIKNLGIKKVHKLSMKQKRFVDDLSHSLNQVQQHQEGKIKLQSAEEFLNEL